jgi:hypothetical protein
MTATAATTASSEMLLFQATNVTGTQEIPFEFGRNLPARAVTDSIASRMALPEDVPWTLRDDDSSAYLDEERPIGDQIAPGARLTITPKTHLAARELRVG